MPIFAYICLALFAVLAFCNAQISYHIWRYGKHASHVSLVGIILFFFGTLGWREPIWFWLLLLLDTGTLVFLVSLPVIMSDIFSQSIFTKYSIYQNANQKLTLYKTKNRQTFRWEWLGKTPNQPNQLPFLAGFGGDWQQQNDKFIFSTGEQQLIATLKNNQLCFTKIAVDNYYHRLSEVCLNKIS